MSRRLELLEVDHDEPEMLHSILSKLPKPLDLDGLISKTQDLFRRCPPERLPHRAWSHISSYSVLKTTRDPHALSRQTFGDGERYFDLQARQIQRKDQIKALHRRFQAIVQRYRRPARWTGAAVLVAVLALYFGRTGGTFSGAGWVSMVHNAQRRAVDHLWHLLARILS